MARHIGIVACSAEGAALCYRTLCSEAPALMGEHMHPEVSMHTYPLAEYMVHIRAGDWRKVAELMLGPFSGFSGHLYSRPEVSLEVREARQYLYATAERFDLIQLSLLDSF